MSQPKYKAVIFDMDGTVLDTLMDLTNSTNYALKKNGYPTRSIDEIRQFVGNGITRQMTRALPEGSSEEEIEKAVQDFKGYYKDHCAEATKAYDGVPELIRDLRAKGIKTAVVSNKPDFAVEELCKQYFDGLFDTCMGEREAEGIRKKPASDMVDIILSRLEVEKDQAVYVGDSDVDINTALNSGLDCISVTWGFRTEKFLGEHGANIIVDRPDEIKKIVL